MGFPAPGPSAVLASEWTLITLAAAVIIARLYLRVKIQRQRLLTTDFLMCASWVAGVVTASFDIKLAHLGVLDPHVKANLDGYNGTSEETILILKISWAAIIFFFTACYLCKAALLALYFQVFPIFMQKRRIFLWATVIFTALSYITSVLLLTCICLPIETNWSLDPKISCQAYSFAFFYPTTWALHFVGDLLIFALPWQIVPELQLKKSVKVALYCTFLLGLISMVFCVARIITVQTALETDMPPLSLIELWTMLDCNIGLLVACLPSLRPFFRGRGNLYYPYNSKSGTKSNTIRPSEAGFTVIDHEPYRAKTAQSVHVDPHRPPHFSSTSNGDDMDHWDDGKKSNASDIELVQMRADGS